MDIKVAIDEELLSEAQKAGGLKTREETVNEALREFAQRRRSIEILEIFGQIDFARKYNNKKGRLLP